MIRLSVLVLGVGMAFPSNAEPIFADGFESPQPPPDPCSAFGIKPPGYTIRMETWDDIFGGPYPYKPGYPTAIGSFTINHRDIAGQIIVVPIAPTGPASFTWAEAQPIPATGYRSGRPAEGVLVAISDCPGDIREPTLNPRPPSGEDFTRKACRRYEQSSSLYWTGGTGGFNQCGSEYPGQQLYLNFLFEDPRDGYHPDTDSCYNDLDKCEAIFQ